MLIYSYVEEIRRKLDNGEFLLKKLHEPKNSVDSLTFTFDDSNSNRLNVLMHDPVTVEMTDEEGNELDAPAPPLLDARLKSVGVCGIIGAQFKSPTHVARVIELEVPTPDGKVFLKVTGRRG